MTTIRGASFNIDKNGKLIAEANEKTDYIEHMSKDFQDKLNENLFKRDNTFYNYKPTNPVNGDVYWQTNGVDSGVAYRYDGANWIKREDSVQNLYGSQIYGVSIHGARIVGGTFQSQETDMFNKPLFSVDSNGEIFGANFKKDLITTQASGHNGRTYEGYVNENSGFNINNGIMTMQAKANNKIGHNNIPYDNYYAQTFMEPDYIKLRGLITKPGSIYDDGTTEPIKRTDIRSGEIVIGEGWDKSIYRRSILDTNHIESYTGYFGNISTSKGEDGIYASNVNATNIYANNIQSNGVFMGRTITGQPSVGTINGGDLYIHDQRDNTIGLHARDIISHGKLLKNSALSMKRNIEEYDNKKALSQILATDVYSWKYKDKSNKQKENIGPIIDDINDINNKKYSISDDLIENVDGRVNFNESNAISLLIASVQELAKTNSDQSIEIAILQKKITNLEQSTK